MIIRWNGINVRGVSDNLYWCLYAFVMVLGLLLDKVISFLRKIPVETRMLQMAQITTAFRNAHY